MFQHISGQRALADLTLLERVVQYKQTYFQSSWANYGSATPGTLRLVPPEHRLHELGQDYKRMREMFVEAPPSFEKILDLLRVIEDRVNEAGRT